jgi:hypothetical protein
MKNMSNILVIVIGSLMVFSQPLIVALHAETLQNKFCGMVSIPRTGGVGIACNSSTVGSLDPPCTGSTRYYPMETACQDEEFPMYSTCTERFLEYVECEGIATENSTEKLTCFGVPSACLVCALIVATSGVVTLGQSVVITASYCSATACVGTVFYNPDRCCYTSCAPCDESEGTVHVWKKGC